jgi:hypothetical protein
MATVKRGSGSGAAGRRRISLTALVVVALVGFVAAWFWRESLVGQARAGAAYGAHTACSCRHIGGRELPDCRKDFVAGMGVVMLSEDVADRTVTASVPLLASETARYSEGRGCVLEPWTD